MKQLIGKLLAMLGLGVYRLHKKYAFGTLQFDYAFEMQRILTSSSSGEVVVFDVGAFVGETALKYNSLFPGSTIYAFEPFPDSYAQLAQNTAAHSNIIAVNKGVGDREGSSKFNSNSFAPTNSLLSTHQSSGEVWGSGLLETTATIDIELTTIDSFVAAHKISNIHVLKMDVQGAEYLVLKGAEKSLQQGVIKMVYTEIITMPTYEGQLDFDEILRLMKSYGFKLFNLYNWSITKEGELRQVDAIFVYSEAPKNG